MASLVSLLCYMPSQSIFTLKPTLSNESLSIYPYDFKLLNIMEEEYTSPACPTCLVGLVWYFSQHNEF